MPWMPARSADKLVISQCLKLEKGKVIRVESYKGDRWVEIRKIDSDNYEIIEKGYNNTTYNITSKELKGLIKKLFDIEFPRSHQVRVNITS
ncbi:hypothetical protein DFR86_07570 [Acidianus sulfidivorans JP7]|uniref:Uncharacterized protein n=1 Tax=Acidianus sulfidivorans JP7 TaxID=619593 RepID=A0A2U9IN34_9CREN|nr:hypothetical protein [Acidianus sulfidivorans]AWR97421.1 hypothetical protein DFR86_07570 [Acidianus sulfidivorans JP7]